MIVILPPVGTELSIEEMIELVNSFVTSSEPELPYEYKCRQNERWVRNLAAALRNGGTWGWIYTKTFWERTDNGFKRKK